jgi:hypothetical protein
MYCVETHYRSEKRQHSTIIISKIAKDASVEELRFMCACYYQQIDHALRADLSRDLATSEGAK